MQAREHERFPVRVPVYLSLDGELHQTSVPLRTSDVSGGGLSFESTREIAPGTVVDIILAGLGHTARDAHIKGTIVYALRDPESGRYTIGIQFRHFVNIARQQLVERLREMTL